MDSGLGANGGEAEPLNFRIRLLNCVRARGPGPVGFSAFSPTSGVSLSMAPGGAVRLRVKAVVLKLSPPFCAARCREAPRFTVSEPHSNTSRPTTPRNSHRTMVGHMCGLRYRGKPQIVVVDFLTGRPFSSLVAPRRVGAWTIPPTMSF